MTRREVAGRPRARFMSPRLELGCSVVSLLLGCVIAAGILLSGNLTLKGDNVFAFLDSTLLGPLLALAGVWIDARRGNSFGLIVLGLAALLALDGAIATYFLGLPVFLLVCASLGIGIRRQILTGATHEHV
jgi:hypothetical protein